MASDETTGLIPTVLDTTEHKPGPKILLELRSALVIDQPKIPVPGVTKEFLDPGSLSHLETRRQEHLRGYQSIFCHADRLKSNRVDILISDNTVNSLPSDLTETIPNFMYGTVQFSTSNYNSFGQYNKGAGVWETWNYNRKIFEKYDYIISFEPRQRLLNFNFIQNFLSCPRNLFGWGTEQKRDFYTGLFAIETDLLLEYIKSMDPVKMCNDSISIELSLMEFVQNSGRPFEILDKVEVIRYESMHGNKEYH